MPDAKIEQNLTFGGVTSRTSKTYTAGSETTINDPIATDATDLEVALVLIVSEIKAFFMVCDISLTVKTNSSGAPDETFTLEPGVPIVWTEDDGTTNPLATNITKLFVTNPSSTVIANFQFGALFDPTP